MIYIIQGREGFRPSARSQLKAPSRDLNHGPFLNTSSATGGSKTTIGGPYMKNQAQAVAQAHDALGRVWFIWTLAVIFASVFYFGGYYFWAYLWRVLTGD